MTSRGRATSGAAAGAVLVVALSLRGPIVAVAPVVGALRADLGLTAATAGLLTTIPVVCFAVATPPAAALISRAGPERAVVLSLLGVLLGTVVRSLGGTALVLVGTAIIGTAITIGNVVVPVVIRRVASPQRVGAMTGAYTAALNVGSMITSVGTAPLAAAVGWRAALAAWGVLVLVGWSLWAAALRGTGLPTDAPGSAAPPASAGSTLAEPTSADRPTPHRPTWAPWLLALAFGGQAFSYYGITAWMPTLLMDRIGMSVTEAGASSSIFQVLAVAGALGVPVLLARRHPWVGFTVVGALWLSLPLGLLLSPGLWWLWSATGGIAQGGGITMIFILVVRLSLGDQQTRRTSALVQGVGYALGALGPSVVGGVHDLTGAWVAPLLVVVAALGVLVVAGLAVALRAGAAADQPPVPASA